MIKQYISQQDIELKVEDLAKDIASKFSELTIVAVLKGSFMFVADLSRQLSKHNVKLEIDFLNLSSYEGNKTSSEEVKLLRDITLDIKDKTILIIDDIFESGYTLSFASVHLAKKGAGAIYSMALLEKEGKNKTKYTPDYTGFKIEDKFVVGYGMDYANKHRELPYIGYIS